MNYDQRTAELTVYVITCVIIVSLFYSFIEWQKDRSIEFERKLFDMNLDLYAKKKETAE